MEIAIGLPNPVPGTTGEQLTEWARRADSGGFSSLGTIDRIVYPNLEPLVSLGAAAGVTERIGLATTILIAPHRANAALIAKQAATVHVLSGGRMTLGIAVGAREDDYETSPVDFQNRGREFDGILRTIRRVWAESDQASGDPASKAIGPDVSVDTPDLLLGGAADVAFRRAAEHGDGWIMGGGTPEQFAEGRVKLEQAWKDAGRDGEPRTGALAYFSLGDQAEENARRYLGDYYAWLGEYAEGLIASAAKDADTVQGYIRAFDEAGCGELFFMPCTSDPAQVDMLAEVAL